MQDSWNISILTYCILIFLYGITASEVDDKNHNHKDGKGDKYDMDHKDD